MKHYILDQLTAFCHIIHVSINIMFWNYFVYSVPYKQNT
jgi:hypothetical protein